MRSVARVRSLDARLVDGVVAAALMIVAVAQAHGDPVGVICAAAIAATVALRRWSAAGAVLTGLLAALIYTHTGDHPNLAIGPLVLVLDYYMLGRRSHARGDDLIDLALLSVAIPLIAVLPGDGHVIDVVTVWSFFVAMPFAAGRTIGTRSALTDDLRRVNEHLEDEQRIRARRAALEERTRIARELHDVIAHSVSVMVIQASAARSVAADDPAAAHEALHAVQGCGREALVEMRRMIGVLRHGELELTGATGPGMAQLDALAARARASGLPVDVRIDGAPRALPSAVDLAAFRVVQEALTNAIKHAGPATARVHVTFKPTSLELEITDTGGGPPRSTAHGHGLVGMHERLVLFGGELDAGARRGGGFRVRATLPLADGVMA